jgi:HD superfamily phosphohydrolase
MNLKSLIKEQVYHVRLEILEETIISDIIALILSPKAKKNLKALQNDPEYIELEKQAKLASKELEMINRRLERNLEKQQKLVNDMKKAGVKVEINMNAEQMYQAYKSWQSKEAKRVGNPEWSKFFK